MKHNPQSKETHPFVTNRTTLEKKFAAYDKFIKSGYKLFGDDYCDERNEYLNDDDADCNEANCC